MYNGFWVLVEMSRYVQPFAIKNADFACRIYSRVSTCKGENGRADREKD